jgi:hypothetical protein
MSIDTSSKFTEADKSEGQKPVPAPAPVQTPASGGGGFLANQFGLRRVAEKVRRRVRRLMKRPDNSPWVFEPAPRRQTTYVDFIFCLDYLSPNSALARTFHQAFSAYGLSALLVNKNNVEQATRDVRRGWLRPHVYLDLSSRPGDAYEQLLYAAAESGAHTMRRPEHTKWVMKATGHPLLEEAGIPVPPSVILKSTDPDRDLTGEERARVGDRCVIKPSHGEAAKGCVIDVEPTRENIAKAREFNRDYDWLVQRMITWTSFGQRPAYLRAYNVCGHRTLMWWARTKGVDAYDVLTWEDLRRYDLMSAVDLVSRLADVTGMDFFSVEIAILKEEDGPDRYCLIDYLNDQCDLDSEAHPKYSPNEWYTRFACERFAEFTYRKKHDLPEPKYRGLFLPDSK